MAQIEQVLPTSKHALLNATAIRTCSLLYTEIVQTWVVSVCNISEDTA